MMAATEAEVAKLQRHLSLLREEYVKLNTKYAELERKYNLISASSQAGIEEEEENFVSRLLRTVANLFDKELYSDLTIHLNGMDVCAHKFVLAARSDRWGTPAIADVSSLDFTGIPKDIGLALLKWIYTDEIDMKADEDFTLSLMKAAGQFDLKSLVYKCELALMSSINVRNCIKYFQTAEEIGATSLKQHCSQLITNHWNDFTKEDFSNMSAPLLYNMFKSKSPYPLHMAVQMHREDVVFLYLVENNSLIPEKLNEPNDLEEVPLDLALQQKLESIASTLVSHKADVNWTDDRGRCLLHKAVLRGDEFAATFLINNRAAMNAATEPEKETPLHIVARCTKQDWSTNVVEGMNRVAQLLQSNGANPNLQDNSGRTALHNSIIADNEVVFSLLLDHTSINLELRTVEGHVPLWFALHNHRNYAPDGYTSRLVQHGASPNAINKLSGDSLLHMCAKTGGEEAALFLVQHDAKPSVTNNKGETPLHCACQSGLVKLATELLNKGANPNAQTSEPVTIATETVSLQTPLHISLRSKHEAVATVFLDYKAKVTQSGDLMAIIPNFNLKDSLHQTVFSLSLWMGLHSLASQFLKSGASIDCTDAEGNTLLHQAIEKQDTESALFLLCQGAAVSTLSSDNETPLQMSIRRHLPIIVDALCEKGVDMNAPNADGDVPLWQALDTGQEDIASSLVQHGCDTTSWAEGPDQCQHTLLHRAIDENNEAVGCFLIRSMCDINSSRRPGPNGEGGEEAFDGQTPLHLACQWGQELVVQCLLEHGANLNIKDAEGKTPIHIAIVNQHHVIIGLLLAHPSLDLTIRDKTGLTPFAAAMMNKNNKAAQAILNKEPTAAEQMDNKGRNFMHIAIQKSDIESVLFLISIHASVNSRVQDSHQLTPLHLAVQSGSEMIVRNLLLAGAHINDVTHQKQTALHLAAMHDQPTICSVLIENKINVDAVDDNLNNALHLACQKGSLPVCRVLLTESQINAEVHNMRGQMPMHMLGQYGRENAAPIFELFMECMPNYPIDKPDVDGNTVLLLAYLNGNVNLCKAVVRAGAMLGATNKQGISIFTAQVATKQLLFRLLDLLSKEPPWTEGEVCNECLVKFGIATRKHHCRHCGRLLCNKCSDKVMPILKFDQSKPVRVCGVCFDVLTLGSSP